MKVPQIKNLFELAITLLEEQIVEQANQLVDRQEQRVNNTVVVKRNERDLRRLKLSLQHARKSRAYLKGKERAHR